MNSWSLGSNVGSLDKYNFKKTVATFFYPCASNHICTYYQSTLRAGYYKVEVWGAEGGNTISEGDIYTSSCNKGGYSVGVLKLNKTSQVYVFVGGKGQDASQGSGEYTKGGFNGGGDSIRSSSTYYSSYGGAGGGASDIRVDGIDIQNRVIVAGGAGGLGPDLKKRTDCSSYGGGLTAGSPVSSTSIFAESIPPASQNVGNSNGIGSVGYVSHLGSGGGGGGGYYGGLGAPSSQWFAGSAGGGSGFIGKVISFKNIFPSSISGYSSMPSPESDTQITGKTGNGAARITILGYYIESVSLLDDCYDPGSNFVIDLLLNSLDTTENATVRRALNVTSDEVKILEHNDDGHDFYFRDNFLLPEKSCFLKISYIATTKSGTTTTSSYDIVVNIKPKIKFIEQPKQKYIQCERSFVEIEIYDDSWVNLTMKDENEHAYFIEKVNCYCKSNRTKYSFFAGSYDIGTKHDINIYCIDEFGFKSNILNFEYKIVQHAAPEISVDSNLSYYFSNKDFMKIDGVFHDIEGTSKITFYTMIDNGHQLSHGKQNIDDLEWHVFNISRNLFDVNTGIHTLIVFAIDDNLGKSNSFIHKFALVNGCNIPYKASKLINRKMKWIKFVCTAIFSKFSKSN